MNIDEINQAIEYSLIGLIDQADGLVNVYKPEGNYVVQFPTVDFWEFNRTGLTRLREDQADKAIQEMLDFHKKQGSKSISWVIGPLTTPKNLAQYLEKNNFKYHSSEWGMYLPTETELQVQELQGLLLKEVTLEEIEKKSVQTMIEQGYGMPEGSAILMKHLYEHFSKKCTLVFYIGYEGEKPVAFGNLVVIPGTKIGFLGGAATLPDYRGKGLYSNLLKIRKEKAKALGLEYLVIQAREDTSAPIALKHGFQKVCTLDFYVLMK